MLALAVLGYLYREADQGVQDIARHVEMTVGAEAWLQQQGRTEIVANAMHDDEISLSGSWSVAREEELLAIVAPERTLNVEVDADSLHIANGFVAARVRFELPGGSGTTPVVLRQTRFYRRTTEGWARTDPQPSMWGTPKQLETHHLIWHYHRRDEAVVQQVAAQVDALYVQLRQDYGLPR